MIFLKILKRLFWDFWLVIYNITRDIYSRPTSSNEAVLDLYEFGLHCSDLKLSPQKLSILDTVYTEWMTKSSLVSVGQGTGRVSCNGMLDDRLTGIVEDMREVANSYLCVRHAHLELTYLQESGPVDKIVSVPGGEFHIDDNKANLKFFVYLSDVTAINGPFVVVPKTHRWRERRRIFVAFNWALTKRRNALYYKGDSSTLEIKSRRVLGTKGTFFIADTTAWHKAEPVLEGTRKVFVASFNR